MISACFKPLLCGIDPDFSASSQTVRSTYLPSLRFHHADFILSTSFVLFTAVLDSHNLPEMEVISFQDAVNRLFAQSQLNLKQNQADLLNTLTSLSSNGTALRLSIKRKEGGLLIRYGLATGVLGGVEGRKELKLPSRTTFRENSAGLDGYLLWFHGAAGSLSEGFAASRRRSRGLRD